MRTAKTQMRAKSFSRAYMPFYWFCHALAQIISEDQHTAIKFRLSSCYRCLSDELKQVSKNKGTFNGQWILHE